ncbi:hypothetical protein [Bacillus anthracis]|nr:hypothetical protein [Bacillus anthracis]MEB9454188.1 hypothetical protein [Bacillus anthracis]
MSRNEVVELDGGQVGRIFQVASRLLSMGSQLDRVWIWGLTYSG